MKILITGGTGFLGRRLVQALAYRHDVTLLARPSSNRRGFPKTVAFATGDVTDRASLEAAMQGHDHVVHAAALVKLMAPAAQFDAINVGGLENVLAAARAVSGIQRVVYVSSFMAFGPSDAQPNRVHTEQSPVDDRRWINHYERTKTLADRVARRAIDEGAPLNVVYPGVIYGPGVLTEGNIIVRHLLDLARGKVPALMGDHSRQWNYVFVENVVEGIVEVLQHAPRGERYILGGDNVTLETFYRTAARITGVRVPSLHLPRPVARFTGLLMKGAARLTRSTPTLTPDIVEVYHRDWGLDSSTAERDLGYRWRTLDEGLTQTLRWLRDSGTWPADA
ncbi:MAG: NAD-dependent epimerase/dehydratase family protein [Acidobacteriota bacterium]